MGSRALICAVWGAGCPRCRLTLQPRRLLLCAFETLHARGLGRCFWSPLEGANFVGRWRNRLTLRVKEGAPERDRG